MTNIVNVLRDAGFSAFNFSEYKTSFYHEGVTPVVGSIKSVGERETSRSLFNKPDGVLWLSPNERDSNPVLTSWRHWAVSEDFITVGADHGSFGPFVSRAVFEPDAVILELDESSVKRVNGFVDGSDREWSFSGFSGLMELIVKDVSIISVDWIGLFELGVSAVRVDGWVNREYFHGWDCDSLTVLDGSSITDWFLEPAVVDYEDIINFEYY